MDATKPDLSGLLQALPPDTLVHAGDWQARRLALTLYTKDGGAYAWHEPRSPAEDKSDSGLRAARPFYTCGYCGSMHPTELVAAIKGGAGVSWADFKYGWPHKVYVESAPNRYAGEMEVRSQVYENGKVTNGPEAPAAALTHGKFYTLHLMDANIEQRAIIERAMGLQFEFKDDGVRWTLVSKNH